MPPPPRASVTDPPIPPALLSRMVLSWRRDSTTQGSGAHLRRHQGHSLEFREYLPWAIGDDIRNVDWRASARQPRRGALLSRSFEAEEQMSLAILIDNRPEMLLPETMPRLLYALWTARALTQLALEKGDQVILARLFDGPGEAALSLQGARGASLAREWTERLWHHGQTKDTAPPPAFADLSGLARKLRPAGALILLSDMLFDDPGDAFRRFARAAQRNRRSFSILQLDSTRHEIGLLRKAKVFHLVRPETRGDDPTLFDEAPFEAAKSALQGHWMHLRQNLEAGGLDWPLHAVHWPEADPAVDLAAHFLASFPRLPLLAGLRLGGGR